MPKASSPKQCFLCEQDDMVRRTFMLCVHCSRPYCSKHGDVGLEQCTTCLEDREETE